MVKQGRLFIISAPSGAGKTSLVTALVDRLSPHYKVQRIITYTTKQPRLGDVHGRDYYFVSVEEFEEKIEQGFFIEWSKDYGHYYGTSRDMHILMNSGVSVFLVIDRKGAQQVFSILQDAVLIWIYTKSIEILKERLQQRATENELAVEFRLQRARHEVHEEQIAPFYQYHIINDSFQDALFNLEMVVVDILK